MRIRKLVFAAVLAALTAVCTAMVPIALPIGYVHPGDALVLLSGFLLGPLWGGVAAGLGSAIADLLLGYTMYAPGTFFIKALSAILCALICRQLLKDKKLPIFPLLLAGIVAEAAMVGGYFLYESLLLGYGLGATASLFGNALQGLFGTALFTVLALLFKKRHISLQ